MRLPAMLLAAALLTVAGCGSDVVVSQPAAVPVDVPPPAETGSAASSSSPRASFTTSPSGSVPSRDTPARTADPDAVDYIAKGIWHRVDGTKVKLPRPDYLKALMWNGRLVATYAFPEYVWATDVIDYRTGKVVESFRSTGPPVVNGEQSMLAYLETDGTLLARWDGGEKQLAELDLSGPGETAVWTVAAVAGGSGCGEGCLALLNNGGGADPVAYDARGPVHDLVPGAVQFSDVGDDGGVVVSAVTEVTDGRTCGGVYDVDDRRFQLRTCEFQAREFHVGAAHLAAPPSYYDGLGPGSIGIAEVATGNRTNTFVPETGFVGGWAWSEDGRLLFDHFDGNAWHLTAMATDGTVRELTDPIKGEEFDSPFTLIAY